MIVTIEFKNRIQKLIFRVSSIGRRQMAHRGKSGPRAARTYDRPVAGWPAGRTRPIPAVDRSKRHRNIFLKNRFTFKFKIQIRTMRN